MIMTKYTRLDSNHPEIVQGLKGIGATVQTLANVGGGCPDLLVGWQDNNYLFEVKPQGQTLRKNQRDWHLSWQGQVRTVWDLDDCLKELGLL